MTVKLSNLAKFTDDSAILVQLNDIENTVNSAIPTLQTQVSNIQSNLNLKVENLNDLNITATSQELNYNDITTLGVSEPSRVVTTNSNGVTTFSDAVNEGFSIISSVGGLANINCVDSNVFSCVLQEDTTFSFINAPSAGVSYAFTLKLTQDTTARTVTWPASVDWADATAPIISAGSDEVDVFVFFTHDGGTTWYGFTAGQVMS